MKNPSEERRKYLKAVADAHDKWVRENLKHVQMDPERSREGSDYNLHYLDVDAPPEIEAKFQEMLKDAKNE